MTGSSLSPTSDAGGSDEQPEEFQLKARLAEIDKHLATLTPIREEWVQKGIEDLNSEKAKLLVRLRSTKPLQAQMQSSQARLDRLLAAHASLVTEVDNLVTVVEAKRHELAQQRETIHQQQEDVSMLQDMARAEAQRLVQAQAPGSGLHGPKDVPTSPEPHSTSETRHAAPGTPEQWAMGLATALTQADPAMAARFQLWMQQQATPRPASASVGACRATEDDEEMIPDDLALQQALAGASAGSDLLPWQTMTPQMSRQQRDRSELSPGSPPESTSSSTQPVMALPGAPQPFSRVARGDLHGPPPKQQRCEETPGHESEQAASTQTPGDTITIT